MDFRLESPALVLLVAGSGAGKSYLTKQAVENRKHIFKHDFEKIIWHYSEWQEMYESLQKDHGVIFIEGPPTPDQYPPGETTKWVICDDFQDQITKNNSDFVQFAIKSIHHRNLHFWLLLQTLFPPKLKQISLQAHYVILMKQRRDLSQIRTFCLQVDPVNWRSLLEAYHDATREAHSHIIFDFHPRQKDHLRVRSGLLENEDKIVYIPKSVYKSSMLSEQ